MNDELHLSGGDIFLQQREQGLSEVSLAEWTEIVGVPPPESAGHPASPEREAGLASARQTGPEGPRVTPPARDAGDLGGPAPGPRTALIGRADCSYGVVTLMTTVASSDAESGAPS